MNFFVEVTNISRNHNKNRIEENPNNIVGGLKKLSITITSINMFSIQL